VRSGETKRERRTLKEIRLLHDFKLSVRFGRDPLYIHPKERRKSERDEQSGAKTNNRGAGAAEKGATVNTHNLSLTLANRNGSNNNRGGGGDAGGGAAVAIYRVCRQCVS